MMHKKEARRRRTQSASKMVGQAGTTSPTAARLSTPAKANPPGLSPCKRMVCNKENMAPKSLYTPVTCQNTPSTTQPQDWDARSTSPEHPALSPSTTGSPKQFRVLFSESVTSSPLGTLNKRRNVSSPTTEDWREQTSKLDQDMVHGGLSMDSSLTSSSSLCDDNDLHMNTSSNTVHWKAVLWQCSRPRSLLFLLTALGIVFSSLTIIVSTSIRHPNEAMASETALRTRLLPRHRVRKREGPAVSLTTLAQGRVGELQAVTLRREEVKNGQKKRRRRDVKKLETAKTTFIGIRAVKEPLGWRKAVTEEPAELHFYHEQGLEASKPRIAYLSDPQLSASHPPHRHVKQYPADFTDQTQLYPVLDSSDERIKGMEPRKPYVNGECVPMSDWQTTFYPSCNAVHELGLAKIGKNPETSFDLFGKKGFWRNAWKVEMNQGNDVFVLKTLKVRHNFEEAHFEHDRVDAVAMERLTGSPHVIDIFGFCGHSVMTEYADGKRLGSVADKASKTPLVRLQMAADIAEGLADVHGIDGDDKVSFVHLDVNPANVVIVGNKLKLNDFNIGIIRRWNTTSNEACGFPAQYPNPQWRSPEEARNEESLTEKVDVFSLGHIFYRLISKAEPWNRLEPGGKPEKAEVNEKVKQGILPTIPDFVSKSNDPEIIAIREAMLQCYRKDSKDRPSARQIATALRGELIRLKNVA